MRDYARLCKALRHCATHFSCDGCGGKCSTSSNEPRTKSVITDAADAIEELLAAVPHWISVEDELPEKNANYLTYGVFLPLGVKAMDMFRFDGDHWMVSEDVKITHWMPLPEPPKEDAE